MTFDEYWNQGGAKKFRERRNDSETKEAARAIWNEAMKFGRTNNNHPNRTFDEYWNMKGIGEDIDKKNRWSLFFQIDKQAMKNAMREVWNAATEHGQQIKFDSSNTCFS